jgi:protein BUR2
VAKVAQKDPNLVIDEQSKEYWRWRDSILMHEEMMLEKLTFDLMVENPYNIFFGSLLPRMGLEHNKPLRKSAWTFCNDAALTPMALVYGPREIAIAAIFFATSVTGEKIEDGPNGEPWWKMLGANEERTVQATSMLLDFYVENPLRKLETKGQGSPEFNLEATRRRGDTLLSQTEAGSSQTVTPSATDRGETLSPRVRLNGRGDHEGGKSHSRTTSDEAAFAVADAHLARGDSDEVLKAAANDLDAHQSHANGDGVSLPMKRMSPDAGETNGEREEKRARLN